MTRVAILMAVSLILLAGIPGCGTTEKTSSTAPTGSAPAKSPSPATEKTSAMTAKEPVSSKEATFVYFGQPG